jgi:hypothetical protein
MILIDAGDSLDSPYAEKREVGQGVPAGHQDFLQIFFFGGGRGSFLIYQYRPERRSPW